MSTEFHLGQRVRVRARVEKYLAPYREELDYLRDATVLAAPCDIPSREERVRWSYNHYYRCIVRRPLVTPREGIIVGYTFRFCGERWWDEDAGWLTTSGKGVKVWRVATTLRWSEPLDVLTEDVEVLVLPDDGEEGR
jgi:hypothetical protein